MITWRLLPTTWNGFPQWTPHADDREFADGIVFFSSEKKWRVNNLPKLGRHDSPDYAKRAYELHIAVQSKTVIDDVERGLQDVKERQGG